MTSEFIGTKFPVQDPYGPQEEWILQSLKKQIEEKFSVGKNLIVNLTWFGPQFDANKIYWNRLQDIIAQNIKFDRLFWFGIVDPCYLLPEQLTELEKKLECAEVYRVGPAFVGPYTFQTHSVYCLEEFPAYTNKDVELESVEYVYVNYNRKPKEHRVNLVRKLKENELLSAGVVTLGTSNNLWLPDNDTHLYIDENFEDYTSNGRYRINRDFGNVPYDLGSLGRLDIWKKAFLNVVSETEFFPWDNTFITEKTWKPVLGLRPFVINGQTTLYRYLRDQGFKTFNNYWSHVDIENESELEVHNNIIKVIQYLYGLDPQQLIDMYQDMLPDLLHNRQRFFEFSKEQKFKIHNLFK